MNLLPAITLLLAMAQPIDVNERTPIAFMLLTPSGESMKSRRVEIFKKLDALLRERSTAELRELGNTIDAERCGGHIGCLALRAREEPAGAATRSQWMIMVSVRASSDGRDYFKVLVVDLDVAEQLHQSVSTTSEDAEQFENDVFQRAVLGGIDGFSVAPGAPLESELTALLESSVLPQLRKSGLEARHGAIELHTTAGAQILLDNRVVGVAAAETRLQGVRVGQRELTLSLPRHLSRTTALTILAGETARLDLTLVEEGRDEIVAARSYSLWGGIGVAALGLGLTIWGLQQELSHADSRICVSAPEGCDRQPFLGVFDGAPTPDRARTVSALPRLPLGYSLMLMGSTTAVWTTLGDERRFPWLEVAAGILVGGLSLGVTMIAERAS